VSQRKHDQFEVAPPLRLDGAGEEIPRPCDLVICPECLAVRYIGRSELETRRHGVFESSETKGVFCPGCDQLLFTEETWIQHLAERRYYDNEIQRRKEGERNERPDPLLGRAAVEAEEVEAAA